MTPRTLGLAVAVFLTCVHAGLRVQPLLSKILRVQEIVVRLQTHDNLLNLHSSTLERLTP